MTLGTIPYFRKETSCECCVLYRQECTDWLFWILGIVLFKRVREVLTENLSKKTMLCNRILEERSVDCIALTKPRWNAFLPYANNVLPELNERMGWVIVESAGNVLFCYVRRWPLLKIILHSQEILIDPQYGKVTPAQLLQINLCFPKWYIALVLRLEVSR